MRQFPIGRSDFAPFRVHRSSRQGYVLPEFCGLRLPYVRLVAGQREVGIFSAGGVIHAVQNKSPVVVEPAAGIHEDIVDGNLHPFESRLGAERATKKGSFLCTDIFCKVRT